MGEALETSWPYHSPALSGIRLLALRGTGLPRATKGILLALSFEGPALFLLGSAADSGTALLECKIQV